MKGIDRIATGDEIVENLKAIVAEYYEDRFDNTVISFGNAGSRVLRNVMPFEVGKTNFHSIKLDVPYKSSVRKKSSKGMLSTSARTKYFKVELADITGSKASSTPGVATPFRINEIHISQDQFESSPELITSQIFNNIPRSASFVLVIGFGGKFAQAMHLAFSELLRKKRIAHINVVILPSSVEKESRRTAREGLIKLAKNYGRLKIYDNEQMISKEKLFNAVDSLGEYEKVNQVIARRLHYYSLGLSEEAGVIRRKFLEE